MITGRFASWSSMDYYGRYKALHYMAKGFCDNVAGSIEKKETHMGFWISNETLDPVTVKAKIAVKTLDFQVIGGAGSIQRSTCTSVRNACLRKNTRN
ncbi:MAG: hypothetical protein ACLVBP_09460 [Ruminococcus sp.]